MPTVIFPGKLVAKNSPALSEWGGTQHSRCTRGALGTLGSRIFCPVESPSPPHLASRTGNLWVEGPPRRTCDLGWMGGHGRSLPTWASQLAGPGRGPEPGPCLACCRDSKRGDEGGEVTDVGSGKVGLAPEFGDRRDWEERGPLGPVPSTAVCPSPWGRLTFSPASTPPSLQAHLCLCGERMLSSLEQPEAPPSVASLGAGVSKMGTGTKVRVKKTKWGWQRVKV